MNLRSARGLVIVAAVAWLALPGVADAAAPVHLGCGDTITVDTKLANDLVDCPDAGLVIGADGITLDLNGHTVDGDGAPVADCPEVEPCDVGIVNSAHDGPQPVNGPGYNGVTIKNGTVRQFDIGVYGFGVRSNRLQNLRLTDHTSHGVLFVQGSTENVVEGSQISDTAAPAVVLNRSTRNRIQRNTIADSDEGIHLFQGSDGNVIDGNTFAGNAYAGIVVEAHDNTVSRNRVFRNGDGIAVIGDRNTVSDNQVVDTIGCPEGCGSGIILDGGTGNVIVRNVVQRTFADGILLSGFDPETPTVDTEVRDNRVVHAHGDGFGVGTGGEGTLTGVRLVGNLATGAGDDGFDVRSPGTTLTGNRAIHNGDLGIDAVPGVQDGGGNTASANGDPRQCVGVACGP